jgi:nitronate monooxygenase
MFKTMPKLKIGELTAQIPIIQGGMGVGVSLSNLASAVANEGGIGVIGAAGIGMEEPDFKIHYRNANQRALRREIRKAKEKTNGLLGVNILVALSDYYELVKVAVEEKIDFIFAGAGLPLKSISAIMGTGKKYRTKFVPIVSSGRSARVLFSYWEKHYNEVPDMVVVEGPKAGGHLGFSNEQIDDPRFKLENIFSDVRDVISKFAKKFSKNIPVIAAGGIYSGADILKFMNMGANGVQMATRFVATKECDASNEFKQSYVEAAEEDIVIIKSPVGLPGRAINNRFLEDVKKGIKKPFVCGYKCLKTCDYREAPYCINLALTNAKRGFLENGFAFAGANVYRINKITTVKELINSLAYEFSEAVKNSNRRFVTA